MEELEKSVKLKSTKKRKSTLDDTYIPPDEKVSSRHEVARVKKKSKHPKDDNENYQEVTSKRAFNGGEEELTIKKEKRQKKEISDVKNVFGSGIIKNEEVILEEKKKPKGGNATRDEIGFRKLDSNGYDDKAKISKEQVFKDEKSVDPLPANNVLLTLLSKYDVISDQVPFAKFRQHSSKKDFGAKKLKIARKKERRLEMKRIKKEKMKKNKEKLGKNKVEKSIADCNIKNRKFKEETVELDGRLEEMELKRPRQDEEITCGPTRKRLRSITPDREIVSGYKWKDLTEQQKETFNKKREQRRLNKLTVPKVVLINQANYSSLRLDDEERVPLTLTDIQHFLIYSLHAHRAIGNLPTWVSLKFASKISKVICVVVDGASLSDYNLHEEHLPALKSFNFQLEVITPYAYGGDFAKEFWAVPLSTSQRAKLIRKYGSLEEANLKGEAFESLKKIYPVGAFRNQSKSEPIKEDTTVNNSLADFIGFRDQFPRTELLLKSWDLIRESVPVPFATGYLARKYQGFVRTKDQYLEVIDTSPIWAVDCEMCQTRRGSELTRISVINEDFEVVYESLVKPYNPITNYLTQYSGITREDLKNVFTRLEDVHQDLRSLLPADVILAGHSVGNDLLAMKMFHPYVIDTSVCFNLSGVRARKTKLKILSAELLYERIQEGGMDGHDSVEDAAACLKLLKAKLARSIEWGDAVLGFKRSEAEKAFAQQQLLLRSKEPKTPTVYPRAPGGIIRSGPRAHQTVAVQSNPGKQKAEVRQMTPKTVEPRKQSSPDKPEDQNVLAKSLVSRLHAAGKKNVLVVGGEEFLEAGKQFTDKKSKQHLPDNQGVVFAVQEDAKVLPYGCENAPFKGVSILRLDSSRLKEKTPLEKVDAMVSEATKHIKENVLFTILLTGKPQADESRALDNRGVFMMKIIKPPYVPVTIEDLCTS